MRLDLVRELLYKYELVVMYLFNCAEVKTWSLAVSDILCRSNSVLITMSLYTFGTQSDLEGLGPIVD